MIELRTTLELDDLQAGIFGILNQAERRARAFFMELKPGGRKDVKQHQKDRRGETSSWPPRATTTRKRARHKSKTKRRKGARTSLLVNLARTWKIFTSVDHMKFVHRVTWSGVHDQGGKAGHGARMPRRQFAYWSNKFMDSAVRQYRAYVLKGWTKH